MLNIPVNDTLAFRIAYASQKHDGYVSFQPIPAAFSTNPVFSTPPNTHGLNTTAYITTGQQYFGEDRTSYRISGRWLPVEDCLGRLLRKLRGQGHSGGSAHAEPAAGQSAVVDSGEFPAGKRFEIQHLRSNVSWNINDYLNLTYIAGKSHLSHSENAQDDAGIAIPTSPSTPGGGALQDAQTVYSDFDSYSNELQLKSTGTHVIDWIVGLYAFRERNGIRFDINQYNGYSAAHSIGPAPSFSRIDRRKTVPHLPRPSGTSQIGFV